MSAKAHHWTRLLRILCAIAMVSLGFAHKAPQSFAATTQSAAYQLPDGSFADLCIADLGVAHLKSMGDCEACRLAGSTLVPRPGLDWSRTDYAVYVRNHPRPSAPFEDAALSQPRSRGPPLSA